MKANEIYDIIKELSYKDKRWAKIYQNLTSGSMESLGDRLDYLESKNFKNIDDLKTFYEIK